MSSITTRHDILLLHVKQQQSSLHVNSKECIYGLVIRDSSILLVPPQFPELTSTNFLSLQELIYSDVTFFCRHLLPVEQYDPTPVSQRHVFFLCISFLTYHSQITCRVLFSQEKILSNQFFSLSFQQHRFLAKSSDSLKAKLYYKSCDLRSRCAPVLSLP